MIREAMPDAEPARLRLPHPILLAAAGTGLAVLVTAAMAAAAAAGPHDIAYFTREPAVAVDEAGGCSGLGCIAAGAQANLAILVLWAGAVIALWCGAWMRRARSPWAPFLLAGGALTALLAADDTFQLHESLLPELLPGTEREVLLLYGLVGAAFAWRFRGALARTDVALLALAAACLAGSAGVDRVQEDLHLVEDGLKFLGVVLWTTYFAGTAGVLLGLHLRGAAR